MDREIIKKQSKHVGEMHEKTKELLNTFYEPYNRQLATILKDDGFLWKRN